MMSRRNLWRVTILGYQSVVEYSHPTLHWSPILSYQSLTDQSWRAFVVSEILAWASNTNSLSTGERPLRPFTNGVTYIVTCDSQWNADSKFCGGDCRLQTAGHCCNRAHVIVLKCACIECWLGHSPSGNLAVHNVAPERTSMWMEPTPLGVGFQGVHNKAEIGPHNSS